MRRDVLSSTLFAVLLTACGTQPTPGTAEASPTTPSVVATPSPSAPATPTPAPTPEALGPEFAGLAFIREGDLDGAGPPQVFVVDTDGVARQITSYSFDADFGGANSVLRSTDGTRLAVGVGSPHGVRTDVMDATGSIAAQMRGGWGMEWSPDGSRLVLADTIDVVPAGFSPGVWVLDPSTGAEVQVGSGFFPHWYDDENVSAYRAVGETESDPGEPTVFLLPANGSGEERVLTSGWREVIPSPGFGLEALVGETGPCGAPCSRLSVHQDDAAWGKSGASQPSWSPDGSTVVFLLGEAQTVSLLSWTAGERTLSSTASRVTWAPDGERLALEVQDADREWIVVIDVATGRELLVTPGRSASWTRTR